MTCGGRWGWGTASAMVVVVAGMSGARAGAQEEAADDWRAPAPTWSDRVRSLRPYDDFEWVGLGLMVVALVLLASLQFLARSRRALVAVLGGVFVCGLGGYVLYDLRYVGLNYRMLRDLRNLRADCEMLLQDTRVTLQPGETEISLVGEELPESLQRLRMLVAVVNTEHVYLDYANLAPTIVYDPQGTLRRSTVSPETIRRTWFPDFFYRTR